MARAPTFKQIIHDVWTMTGTMLRHAPGLVLTVLVISTVLEWMRGLIPAEDLGGKALRELAWLTGYLLLAPVEFAAYRLLLLDVRETAYRADLRSRRFLRFFAWYAAFQLIASVPLFAFEIEFSSVVLIIVWIILSISIVYVLCRMWLLLPAFAVSGPGVSYTDVWFDTRGKLWPLIKVFLAIAIPLLVAMTAVVALKLFVETLIADDEIPVLQTWMEPFFIGVIQTAIFVPSIAASAFLFVQIGDRVKRGMLENSGYGAQP